MVNNNNVGICTKFFQCDVSLIKQFSLNFFDVVDNNIDQTQIVVPCFIKLWDNCDSVEGTNHAVIYIPHFDHTQHGFSSAHGAIFGVSA